MKIQIWVVLAILAIGGSILGYIIFNIAIIESHGIANYGLMNLLAGILSLIIFHNEVRSKPQLLIALLGAIGIVAIVFGLRWTHQALSDPASTMESVYDLVVFSSVGLWYLVEIPLKLGRTPIRRFDIAFHVLMFGLVVLRLAIHWQDKWSITNFAPVIIAVLGYWLFNISIRLSQKDSSKTRTTNIAMNILGGTLLLIISFIIGGNALSVNQGTPIGVVGIVAIVFCLGKAYKYLGEKGLAPLVVTGTYDGLLIFAPIVLSFVFAQKFLVVDLLITFGFIIVMASRVAFYRKEFLVKKHT